MIKDGRMGGQNIGYLTMPCGGYLARNDMRLSHSVFFTLRTHTTHLRNMFQCKLFRYNISTAIITAPLC